MVSYRIHECALPDRHYRDRSTDGSEYRTAYGPSDHLRSAPRKSIADCRAKRWALANYGLLLPRCAAAALVLRNRERRVKHQCVRPLRPRSRPLVVSQQFKKSHWGSDGELANIGARSRLRATPR
jgi:hypothetical protein